MGTIHNQGNPNYFEATPGEGLCDGFDAMRLQSHGRTRSSQGPIMDEVTRLNSSRPGSRGGAGIRIEKMSFGKFDGDIRKYPEFRYEFINFIEPQVEDYLLAFVLKKHLSDAVQGEVSNVMGDYNQMWRRLDRKYGNTGRLIDTILFEVKNLTSSYETNDGILQMINIVEKAARDLDNLNQRFELFNTTTISIIEQAMSSQMKH